MAEKKEIKKYVHQSNSVSNAPIKTSSVMAMKLTMYGLYKIAYNFNVSKYKDVDLFNKENWTPEMWEDFSCSFLIKDFCNDLKIESGGKTRKIIEQEVETASQEQIKLENDQETCWYPWFIESKVSKSEVDNKSKIVKFTFHPVVLSIALGNIKNFSHILLMDISSLKSIYSTKWYQIIKARYNMKGKYGNPENTWQTEPMTIDQLRELFSIDKNAYSGRANNLLTNVVKKPIEELNKCCFNYNIKLNIERGPHNTIKTFNLICEELITPLIQSKNDDKEVKLIKQEKEERAAQDLQIKKMKEKYPEKWAELEKENKIKTPLFGIFADQEIYNKMLESGYKV